MIKATNLSKYYDDYKALDNVSCNIADGKIYGLIGSNGAGKSTFLRLLSGVFSPSAGSITIDDEVIFENEKIKSQIAFVPDELYFLNNSTMDRMAKLYQSAYKNFDLARYEQLKNQFKLNGKKNINSFSKGMKRQAAIILALSTCPKYLLLDETFDGLDPVVRNVLKNILFEDKEKRNTTVILTSHSLKELEDTCEQLALLHKGGLVLESDIANMNTSIFKVQLAFNGELKDSLTKESFNDIELLHFNKLGSVATLIVKGDKEKTINTLSNMQPVILDVLPLNLEELFIYEMQALGYNSDILNFDEGKD